MFCSLRLMEFAINGSLFSSNFGGQFFNFPMRINWQ